MAIPALPAVGKGVVTVGSWLSAAAARVAAWLAGNAGATAAIATRLGLKGSITPGKIAAMMKESPVTSALVLYELGDAGAELLAELTQMSEEAAKVVEGLTFQADPAPSADVSITNIQSYQDELALIRRVANRLGITVGDLIELKNVLDLDMRFYQLYVKLKELKV